MAHPATPYRGIYPVVPTTFTESGELDLASQKRAVDFLIDAGVDGLSILANFSEQFSLADEEREILTRTILEHVTGRVPVIVTTSHYATRICAERSRRAQQQGAAMVMVMPPYHGATFRVPEAGIETFFSRLSDTIDIQLKKGVLGLCVLALLARRDSYAYEIASRLSGAIGMGEGTIYPLMRRMQTDGLVETYLVESSSGPSRKYYRLTPDGVQYLDEFTAAWQSASDTVNRILHDKEG